MDRPVSPQWGGRRLDLDAYLARIGYEGDREPVPTVLRALHAAHTAAFTFENLEVVLGRPVRLDLESVQAKMIRRRRGGTCCEQTLLYAAALDAIGFTFTATASRVRLGERRIRPATHYSLRVELDDQVWFTDVGFGAEGILEPIRLRDGEVARQSGWTYGLVREAGPTPGTAGPLVLRRLRRDGWFDLYAIGTEPRFPADLAVTSYFTSTHPLSPFHDTLLVQKPGADQRLVLRDTELTRLRPDHTEERRRVSAGELAGLLTDEFGLGLDAEDSAALVARYEK
ncbi:MULTISPECIES: arylamine N-acetyltransferase family protein [unclassified Streptomyces]|uniref:arylamine N-acetyltransferase family protein n=1 Tax=unclassified Streptomyces TaxID=2593676 RepID=UPI0016604555|nr:MULTISPECIES: arylamine N-acetyltransferase [unclassified Streptomyces]MBD0711483.1 acetyltransferase [Streptomyces sp. CBMA291]MBD0716018.1 acetyltransferase [Streptomyces sp. CBMA370]